ncbi:hypothetical protein [Fodinicola feengrottensis]|uniref:hypothetical protein n=1 Tax=Fodinicola feengrottensis TaxID=435914 RepID=UPI0013D82A9B|nr:hypothetical protein [Fodinicola feengrottensis]
MTAPGAPPTRGTTGQGGTTDQGTTDQPGTSGNLTNDPGRTTGTGTLTAACGPVFYVPAAVIGFLGTLVTGFACVLVMSAARRRTPVVGPVAAAAGTRGGSSPPVSAPPSRTAGKPADREQLLETLIYVRDRATATRWATASYETCRPSA